MFVVRRAFKSAGVCYKPGDVIKDIARVKRIKDKLGMRKIIEVTDNNFDEMRDYFIKKFGVDIQDKPTPANEPKENPIEKSQAAKVQVAKIQAAKISADKQPGRVV